MTSAPSFRLLPVEATEAMLEAGMATLPGPSDLCLADIEDIYVTMVSDAPVMAEATDETVRRAAEVIEAHTDRYGLAPVPRWVVKAAINAALAAIPK